MVGTKRFSRSLAILSKLPFSSYTSSWSASIFASGNSCLKKLRRDLPLGIREFNCAITISCVWSFNLPLSSTIPNVCKFSLKIALASWPFWASKKSGWRNNSNRVFALSTDPRKASVNIVAFVFSSFSLTAVSKAAFLSAFATKNSATFLALIACWVIWEVNALNINPSPISARSSMLFFFPMPPSSNPKSASMSRTAWNWLLNCPVKSFRGPTSIWLISSLYSEAHAVMVASPTTVSPRAAFFACNWANARVALLDCLRICCLVSSLYRALSPSISVPGPIPKISARILSPSVSPLSNFNMAELIETVFPSPFLTLNWVKRESPKPPLSNGKRVTLDKIEASPDISRCVNSSNAASNFSGTSCNPVTILKNSLNRSFPSFVSPNLVFIISLNISGDT